MPFDPGTLVRLCPPIISTREEDSSSRKIKTPQGPSQSEKERWNKVSTGGQEIPPPPPDSRNLRERGLSFPFSYSPREVSRVLTIKRFRAWARSFFQVPGGRLPLECLSSPPAFTFPFTFSVQEAPRHLLSPSTPGLMARLELGLGAPEEAFWGGRRQGRVSSASVHSLAVGQSCWPMETGAFPGPTPRLATRPAA